MTYHLRVARTLPEHLNEALADPRLSGYQVIWADEDQLEALLYLPRASTRGVGVKCLDNDLRVGLQTLASPADWLIGIKLAELIGHLAGQPVKLEPEGQLVAADVISRHCNPDWLAPRVHLGVELVLEAVFEMGQSVSLQGWSECFHLGPWLMAELGISPETDAEDAYIALIKRMRSHQQLAADPEILRPTGMILDSADGEVQLCCATLPVEQRIWIDTRFLDALALRPMAWRQQQREPVWVPAARVAEYVPSQRLDEFTYLIEPLSQSELLAAAERVERLIADNQDSDWRRIHEFFAIGRLRPKHTL